MRKDTGLTSLRFTTTFRQLLQRPEVWHSDDANPGKPTSTSRSMCCKNPSEKSVPTSVWDLPVCFSSPVQRKTPRLHCEASWEALGMRLGQRTRGVRDTHFGCSCLHHFAAFCGTSSPCFNRISKLPHTFPLCFTFSRTSSTFLLHIALLLSLPY